MDKIRTRIHRELKILNKEREATERDGIYITYSEENVRIIYVCIIGSSNTPYAYSPFLFRFDIPEEYPMIPPKCIMITSDGRTRFNPNLYVCGKVCLSILGTWAGPPWTQTMTITDVIRSIQALVMTDKPLINEPGWENSTLESILNYNSKDIMIKTVY